VVSIRQQITPDQLLGRINASYRTLAYGAIPLGALLGGVLGEELGYVPTLVVGSVVALTAPLWGFQSGVLHLRRGALEAA
jgi:predicted MFS family arabinose efflux permease